MIHPRITLVTAEVVATMRGCSCEAVYQRVDTDAGWQWVFNVGTGRERELRFWSREQLQPAETRSLQLPEVIQQIVPARNLSGGYQKWEVGELLRVSRQRLLELDLRFAPRNGGMWVAQVDLENFFRRRWLFSNCVGATAANGKLTLTT